MRNVDQNRMLSLTVKVYLATLIFQILRENAYYYYYYYYYFKPRVAPRAREKNAFHVKGVGEIVNQTVKSDRAIAPLLKTNNSTEGRQVEIS